MGATEEVGIELSSSPVAVGKQNVELGKARDVQWRVAIVMMGL